MCSGRTLLIIAHGAVLEAQGVGKMKNIIESRM
jgi:hypothetical protein